MFFFVYFNGYDFRRRESIGDKNLRVGIPGDDIGLETQAKFAGKGREYVPPS